MVRGLHNRLAGVIAIIIAAFVGGGARAADAPPFSTVAEARTYLNQNPNGQWAQEAFRMIALASMGQITQGFPQDRLIDGFLRMRSPDTSLTSAQIAELMQSLAQQSRPDPITVPARSNRPAQPVY